MATIEATSAVSGYRKSFARNRKKENLKIDMTPMLDLIFLLITFFVFTTNMVSPATMDLYVPAPGATPQATFESGALTVLIGGEGKLSYYEGKLKGDGSNVVPANALELREEIIKRKAEVIANYIPDAGCEAEAVANGKPTDDCKQKKMMILIKPGPDADYGTVVDVLDEMIINKVARYALVEPDKEDLQFLR